MIEVSPEAIAAIMLGGFFIGVFTGYPLAFVLGTVGLVSGFLALGNIGLVMDIFYTRAVDGIYLHYTLIAVPLFIFMGLMLEQSGIAERLFDVLYLWLGGLRGGLAIVTVLLGTVLATTLGIVAASVAMLTIVALPAMVKRGYSKSLATGAVCAGGCLGILIPPSIMLVVYGPMAQLSVGKLFFAAFIPGFVLAGLYITYITVRGFLQPSIAPTIPAEERAVPLGKKIVMLVKALVPPAFLILSVLGVIFFGVAAPTEAAAIGALAATLLTIAFGRFKWRILREVSIAVVKNVGYIFIIVIMAFSFVGIFNSAGGGRVIQELILSTPGGRWGAFATIMFVTFILGFFMDWIGIVFIIVPIITPIGAALEFDPLWFGMMICVNLQMSFMTPPFAPAIFFVRGTMSPELGITLSDIIHGVTPYVIIIAFTLGLLVVFPQLILWLPGQMIR